MQVQVNGDDALIAQVEADVMDGLSRFADQITRIEVHLSDENAGEGGSDDQRCMIESRPTGLQPMAVIHQPPSIHEACDGALQKMVSKLESSFGRQDNKKGGHSIRDLDPL